MWPGCEMSLVHQNLCDAVGRGVALNGVIKSASTGGGLDAGGCHRVVIRARWILKACGALRDRLGGPALALGLPSGIEVRDRWNRDSGGPWVARALPQTIGGDCVDVRDGGSRGYSPCTRRICPTTAAADFGRIVVWTLFVAASCLPEIVRPAHGR